MFSRLRHTLLRRLFLLSITAAATVAGAVEADHAGFVAYIRGGDVWIRHLPEGREKQLTKDGRNHSPRWSPSGKWLSYRKGFQLWVVRRSGQDAKALNSGKRVDDFAWSPHADTLVYTIANGGVAISYVDEGQDGYLAAPAHPENSSNHGLSWSPEGQWVAYVLERGPDSSFGRSAELWQVGSDGHSALLATTEGADASGIVPAGWTGDYKWVLYGLVPGFSASVQADGLQLRAIPASGGPSRDLGVKSLLHSDWISPAPHGENILVVEGAGRETWTNKHLVLLDLARGRTTQLSDPKLAITSPKWSPDGEKITYAAAPDSGKLGGGDKAKAALFRRRIYLMSRTGYGKLQLTHDPLYRDECPLWDPDGSDILFARIDKSGNSSLWMMHADGSDLRKMLDVLSPAPDPSGYYGHINWSDLFDWRRTAAPASRATKRKVLSPPPVPRSSFYGPREPSLPKH